MKTMKVRLHLFGLGAWAEVLLSQINKGYVEYVIPKQVSPLERWDPTNFDSHTVILRFNRKGPDLFVCEDLTPLLPLIMKPGSVQVVSKKDAALNELCDVLERKLSGDL